MKNYDKSKCVLKSVQNGKSEYAVTFVRPFIQINFIARLSLIHPPVFGRCFVSV